MNKASPFVFISYSREDHEYVEALEKAFESRGISVWIDNHVDHGAKWQEVIENHLAECKAFVVVMSSRSRQSHWVNCEVQCVLELKKQIFPVLLDGNIWLGLRTIQVANVIDGSLPNERFFDSIKACLSRSTKPDPIAVVPPIDPVVPPNNIQWKGDWFVNVGEGVHRTWADCVKYGFIEAGQGAIFSKALKNLKVGSTIYAYISGHGYVGVGTVTSEAVPIKEFKVGPDDTSLLDMPLKAEKPDENKDNLELSEWVVGVKWTKTVVKEDARRFIGAFANPQVVCKLRHRRTLEFLHEEFDCLDSEDATSRPENEDSKKSVWNREWFVNAGEGKGHRSWEDCRKYGFISAGQGPKFARMMKKLEVDDTVYAYVTGAGYVGFGKVTQKAVPIKQFTVEPDNLPLLEMDLEANGLVQHKDDEEYCEWVARIDWRKTFSKDEAIWFKGAFHHLGTACKFKNEATLSYLHEVFDVPTSA